MDFEVEDILDFTRYFVNTNALEWYKQRRTPSLKRRRSSRPLSPHRNKTNHNNENDNSKAVASLETATNDAIANILTFLSIQDIAALVLTCKALYCIIFGRSATFIPFQLWTAASSNWVQSSYQASKTAWKLCKPRKLKYESNGTGPTFPIISIVHIIAIVEEYAEKQNRHNVEYDAQLSHFHRLTEAPETRKPRNQRKSEPQNERIISTAEETIALPPANSPFPMSLRGISILSFESNWKSRNEISKDWDAEIHAIYESFYFGHLCQPPQPATPEVGIKGMDFWLGINEFAGIPIICSFDTSGLTLLWTLDELSFANTRNIRRIKLGPPSTDKWLKLSQCIHFRDNKVLCYQTGMQDSSITGANQLCVYDTSHDYTKEEAQSIYECKPNCAVDITQTANAAFCVDKPFVSRSTDMCLMGKGRVKGCNTPEICILYEDGKTCNIDGSTLQVIGWRYTTSLAEYALSVKLTNFDENTNFVMHRKGVQIMDRRCEKLEPFWAGSDHIWRKGSKTLQMDEHFDSSDLTGIVLQSLTNHQTLYLWDIRYPTPIVKPLWNGWKSNRSATASAAAGHTYLHNAGSSSWVYNKLAARIPNPFPYHSVYDLRMKNLESGYNSALNTSGKFEAAVRKQALLSNKHRIWTVHGMQPYDSNGVEYTNSIQQWKWGHEHPVRSFLFPSTTVLEMSRNNMREGCVPSALYASEMFPSQLFVLHEHSSWLRILSANPLNENWMLTRHR